MKKYIKDELLKILKENKISKSALQQAIGISSATMWKYLNRKLGDPEYTHRILLSDQKIEKRIDDVLSGLNKDTKVSDCPTIREFATTVEDVILYLVGGYQVFDNDGNSFKLINDVIVKYRNEEPIFINPAICCQDISTFFIYKALTLKEGGVYETNEGITVTCLSINEDKVCTCAYNIDDRIYLTTSDLKGVFIAPGKFGSHIIKEIKNGY